MYFQQLITPLRRKLSPLSLPIANESISAGFPSPADDYLDIGIDLNEQLIRNPESTFFLRVSGHSMTDAGINDGDLVIIDRSIDPTPAHIVVAIVEGNFTLKRLTLRDEKLYLEAANSDYSPIDITLYQDVQIWGVAIYSIHNLKSNIKIP